MSRSCFFNTCVVTSTSSIYIAIYVTEDFFKCTSNRGTMLIQYIATVLCIYQCQALAPLLHTWADGGG